MCNFYFRKFRYIDHINFENECVYSRSKRIFKGWFSLATGSESESELEA